MGKTVFLGPITTEQSVIPVYIPQIIAYGAHGPYKAKYFFTPLFRVVV